MKVYRTSIAMAGRYDEYGRFIPSLRAVAYIVAPCPAAVPDVAWRLVPEWTGARMQILNEYDETWPLYPVRIGTGEPKRFEVVPAPNRAAVADALKAMIPPTDDWRPDVEAGWYEVRDPINQQVEGVY